MQLQDFLRNLDALYKLARVTFQSSRFLLAPIDRVMSLTPSLRHAWDEYAHYSTVQRKKGPHTFAASQ